MKFQFILLLTCSATFSRPLHNEADVVEHRLDISHAAVTENNETRKDRVVREADDFGKGFLEQLKETGDSIETLIRHPITTVKNLANATVHPVQTVKNLKAYLSNCTDISNCAGRVVSFGVTLGLSEGLGEIAEGLWNQSFL